MAFSDKSLSRDVAPIGGRLPFSRSRAELGPGLPRIEAARSLNLVTPRGIDVKGLKSHTSTKLSPGGFPFLSLFRRDVVASGGSAVGPRIFFAIASTAIVGSLFALNIIGLWPTVIGIVAAWALMGLLK